MKTHIFYAYDLFHNGQWHIYLPSAAKHHLGIIKAEWVCDGLWKHFNLAISSADCGLIAVK